MQTPGKRQIFPVAENFPDNFDIRSKSEKSLKSLLQWQLGALRVLC